MLGLTTFISSDDLGGKQFVLLLFLGKKGKPDRKGSLSPWFYEHLLPCRGFRLGTHLREGAAISSAGSADRCFLHVPVDSPSH